MGVPLHIFKQLDELLNWPDGWNGYDALAPKSEAIARAREWITKLHQEISLLLLSWLEPNVTSDADGNVVFEWRREEKALTVYVSDQHTEYVKDWGANITTEMEDGEANTPEIRCALWEWLTGERWLSRWVESARNAPIFRSPVDERLERDMKYDIVPKRTIEDFLSAYRADRERFPRRQYVDVDLPIIDE